TAPSDPTGDATTDGAYEPPGTGPDRRGPEHGGSARDAVESWRERPGRTRPPNWKLCRPIPKAQANRRGKRPERTAGERRRAPRPWIRRRGGPASPDAGRAAHGGGAYRRRAARRRAG